MFFGNHHLRRSKQLFSGQKPAICDTVFDVSRMSRIVFRKNETTCRTDESYQQISVFHRHNFEVRRLMNNCYQCRFVI